MKTKVLTAAIMFLLVATTAFATGDKDKTKKNNKSSGNTELVALSGIVTDRETGEALAGVMIKVEETEITVYTDFEGNFELMVAPGSYTVTTSLISYSPVKSSVEAKPSTEQLTLKLENLTVKR